MKIDSFRQIRATVRRGFFRRERLTVRRQPTTTFAVGRVIRKPVLFARAVEDFVVRLFLFVSVIVGILGVRTEVPVDGALCVRKVLQLGGKNFANDELIEASVRKMVDVDKGVIALVEFVDQKLERDTDFFVGGGSRV